MSTRKGETKAKPARKPAAKKNPAKTASVSGTKAATSKAAAGKAGAGKAAAAKAIPAKASPTKSAAAKSAAKPTATKPATRTASPRQPALTAVPPREAAAGRGGASRRPSSARPAELTPKDLERFEQLLLGERQRLLRELGHLERNVLKRSLRETSGELSGYSFHMADVGTDAMEREKAFHFASAEGRALLDVDQALRRLYGGEYGRCESCGSPVSKERLEVVPHARLCLVCKEKEERAQIGRSR